MNTIHTNQINIETADRDTLIGRALSRSLGKTTPDELCPTAEQMASFVDGGGAEKERDRILGHLAACDRCREIYILAHDLSKPEPVQHGRRGWYMVGGALAAAALVVFAVKLTIQQPVPSGQQVTQVPATQPLTALVPPGATNPTEPKPSATPVQTAQPHISAFSVGMAAHQLAQAASPDTLASVIGAPKSGSYGFASSGSRQETAFKAGKELFELELWLAAGDRERAGLAGERLSPLLRSLGGDAATAPLDDLLRQLEVDGASGKLDEIAPQLETLLKTSDQGFVRLGGWVASAKVALGVGKDPYFAGNPPQRFFEEMDKNLSPAAREVLRKLDKIRPGNDTAAFRRLLDELANAI